MITKIYDKAYAGIMIICKLLLIADICITSYAVLGRYVSFIKDPAWSEEIVLTCMIYMAFLSATLAIRKQTHIRMTSLDIFLPKKLCQFLDILGDVMVIVFSLIMIFPGIGFAKNFMKISYVSIPWLPRFWKYFAIPLAGCAIFIFETEIIVKHVRAFHRLSES